MIHNNISQPHLLVVCGKNKKRSRTAEFIYKNDDRFHIRSVGLSPKSIRKITEKDIEWADVILVMEREQSKHIKDIYNYLEIPTIEVLNIPDEFEFMDEELITILNEKIELMIEKYFT
ncbi:MAG: protein-tyrosine-phosphatase [Raineya sp.]|jgi:protein-tyrosine phosphatase|nr:protein-tyrosine-phosphatase [Raineya sp.]